MAHDTLWADLTAKTAAFSGHVRSIQAGIAAVAALDQHLAAELRCPGCFGPLLPSPYILWPCGHALCHGCALKGVERLPDGPKRRLVCVECRHAFHAAQHALGERLGHDRSSQDKTSLSTALSVSASDDSASSSGGSVAGVGKSAKALEAEAAAPAAAAAAAMRQLTLFHNPYVKPHPQFNNHHFGTSTSKSGVHKHILMQTNRKQLDLIRKTDFNSFL